MGVSCDHQQNRELNPDQPVSFFKVIILYTILKGIQSSITSRARRMNNKINNNKQI
jgi:hypothetical protein